MSIAAKTPFEKGNQNQTTTWADCIAWYEDLAKHHPHLLRFAEQGLDCVIEFGNT